MKKVIIFLLLLIPWGFSSFLFPIDNTFFEQLNLPIFTPPNYIFAFVWIIIYILTTISVYTIIKNDLQNKNYLVSLIFNYITNQLFPFFFFTLRSPFLGFVDCILVLITTINLYIETKKINEKSVKLLIPYIVWSIFATILSLTIYIMNF